MAEYKCSPFSQLLIKIAERVPCAKKSFGKVYSFRQIRVHIINDLDWHRHCKCSLNNQLTTGRAIKFSIYGICMYEGLQMVSFSTKTVL